MRKATVASGTKLVVSSLASLVAQSVMNLPEMQET